MQVVIYKQDNGVPAVLIPAPDVLARYGLMAIAVKDVPAGKPFKIVDDSALPQWWPQETWEVSDADLTDGVGGDSTEFPKEVA